MTGLTHSIGMTMAGANLIRSMTLLVHFWTPHSTHDLLCFNIILYTVAIHTTINI